MDNIISDTNLSFAKEAISNVSKELEFNEYKKALWVVFGSYVINMNTTGSDLDLIAIHDRFTKSERTVFNYKNVPIHFTGISIKTLTDDGESRLYGSYFTGKIINPHIFTYGDDKLKHTATYNAGKFISPLAGFLSKQSKFETFTKSQVTSLVFIAYLSTDPSFDSYFLNYFISPKFNDIWISLSDSTIHMLQTSGSIIKIGEKYRFTEMYPDFKSFHSERMKISARHWSYGAICHEGNYKFQDFIFTKAEEKMKKIDPTGKKYLDMVEFLKNESGLSEIYI